MIFFAMMLDVVKKLSIYHIIKFGNECLLKYDDILFLITTNIKFNGIRKE